jgi:hypothetical protein
VSQSHAPRVWGLVIGFRVRLNLGAGGRMTIDIEREGLGFRV